MKLRSRNLIINRALAMDVDASASSPEKSVRGEGTCTDQVNPASGSFLNEYVPVNVSEAFSSQYNMLKEHIDKRFDSTITHLSYEYAEKLKELKTDITKCFVDFQRDIKIHMDFRDAELKKIVQEKFSESRAVKNNEKNFAVRMGSFDEALSTHHSDQVLIDIEPANIMEQAGTNEITNNNVIQIAKTSHSAFPEKGARTDVSTPLKPFSLPRITDSPDYFKSVSSISASNANMVQSSLAPCALLSSNMLNNIPVLTVAPAHSSLAVCSSIVQSPGPKPLRIIKPKLTTEEFISTDFDAEIEDSVGPAVGDDLFLPGRPRVRTRGGLLRGDRSSGSVLPCRDTGNSSIHESESNRGGRRGRKAKRFPVIRRQSERLKKLDSESPQKESLQDIMGNAPLEEFFWGSNSEGRSEQPKTPEKPTLCRERNSKTKSNKVARPSENPSNIDRVCIRKSENNSKSNLSDTETAEPLNAHCKTRSADKFSKNEVKVGQVVVSSNNESKTDEIPKETPRNLPMLSKKGLSLSSPRKKNHIRTLDFTTPMKSLPPRKASTSPKAVSQAKLAQMRSLRRGNLFKTPVKKPKQSWDADLRAFVDPDLPSASGTNKKGPQPKNSGHPHKFLSSSKRFSLKKTSKKTKMKHSLKTKRVTPTVSPIKNEDDPDKICKSHLKESQSSDKSLDNQFTTSEPPSKKKISSKTPKKSTAIVESLKTTPDGSGSLITSDKDCVMSELELPSKTTDELVKQIEKDVLEAISENDGNMDPEDDAIMSDHSNDRSSDLKQVDHAEQTVSVTSEEQFSVSLNKSNNNRDMFLVPTVVRGKIINKTPAKLDNASLLASNMMTPVTKILTEQKSLLENVQFLTPGFLPTPESSGSKAADVRRAGTPSPNLISTQNSDELSRDNSDDSSTGIIECPVRIEEALAAEECVVTPVTKNSSSGKSPISNKNLLKNEQPLRKNTGSNLTPKIIIKGKKPIKKKSYEELIIDQCLKNVEKDLFGAEIKNSSKKCKTDRGVGNKKKIDEKKIELKNNKVNKTNKSASSSKNNASEKAHVDIKLPTFNEMMSRLDKMNKISSDSSTDSSDSEIMLNYTDALTKNIESSRINKSIPLTTFPNGKTRFQNLKESNEAKSGGMLCGKNDAKFFEGTLTKSVISTTSPSIKEEVKDFSYLLHRGSNLEELMFDYFDEGKNGDRSVRPSATLCLFEFPFPDKVRGIQDYKKAPKTKDPEIVSKRGTKEKVVSKNQHSHKSDRPEFIGSPKRDKKSEERKYLTSDEKHRRFSRQVHSKSREYTYSISKTHLSSHRSRYNNRGFTPSFRYRRRSRENSVHSRYKRERAEEYRRRSEKEKGRGERRSDSSETRYLGSRVRTENKRERERARSSERRVSKVKPGRSPSEDQRDLEKKTKDRKSAGHFRRDEAHSRRKEREDSRPSDPRLSLKSRELGCPKPLAESTPYDSKKNENNVLRESSNISLTRSSYYEADSRKSLLIDTSVASDAPQCKHGGSLNLTPLKNKASLTAQPEEGEIEDDENSVVGSLKDGHISERGIAFETTTFSLDPSPQSPPRDPRLSSKLYLVAKKQLELPIPGSKSHKRKIEDLEEGEITDESSCSYKLSTSRFELKRHKLSDITERSDQSCSE